DPDVWARANPALGIRISEEFVRREREALGDEEFARERLGIWVDIDDLAEHVIDPDDWAGCREPASRLSGPVAFSFDVAPDRSSASIGAAGVSVLAARPHVEVV